MRVMKISATTLPVFVLLGSLALLAPPSRTAAADGKVMGEIEVLSEEARATAQKYIDAIVKNAVIKPGEGEASNADADKARLDCEKARRALLVMGPAVYPVVDNAARLAPPADVRPHLNYLKALLAPKAEPELDALRARVRKAVLGSNLNGIFAEANEFRAGKPDPKHAGKRIPPTIQPVKYGIGLAYRSADGSFVLVFGPDADDKTPDCADLNVSEGAAGFVIGIGGRAAAFARTSGHGANVTVTAPLGFAYAWATDGAPGKAPGGTGGEGGAGSASGGAGSFGRSGNGGAGAPADAGSGSSGMK